MSQFFDTLMTPVRRLVKTAGGFIPEDSRTTLGHLADGERIMTRYTPGQPYVEIYASIRGAGSGLEIYGGLPPGVAHYLEHMCCSSSHFYGVGEVHQWTQKNGGFWNAATSADRMSFEMKVVAKDWRKGIDMFADALCRPRLGLPSVQEDKKYVPGERLMYVMNGPFSAFSQRARQSCYGNNSYFHEIVGTKASIASISPDSLRVFHRRTFAADQTRIIVQGNVRHKDVVAAFNESRFHLPRRQGAPQRLNFPLTFFGGDFRTPTSEEGTRLSVLFPMQEYSDYEGSVRAGVLKNLLSGTLFAPLRKASGPYDLGAWLINDHYATHMAFNCTIYPEDVSDTLAIMGDVLAKTASDGLKDKLTDFQKTDNHNWKNRPLPFWRNTETMLSLWQRHGCIPSEKETHDIVQSIKPADLASMADGMLSGPVGVCMEGNLKGLPSREEVPRLLGMKNASLGRT